MPGRILRAVTWPLLLLLHVAFAVFSLLLRITESFSHSETVSRAPSIPHHVALCLPSRQLSRRRNGRYSMARGNEQERRALVETLKRTARWAVQDGVRELSVYSDLGMSPSSDMMDMNSDEQGWEGVPQELQRLTSTHSPSSSRTSSTQSSSPTRISTPPDSLSSISLPLDGRPDTIHTEGDPDSEASESSSPTPKSRSRSSMRNRQVLKKAPASPTTTLVLGDSRRWPIYVLMGSKRPRKGSLKRKLTILGHGTVKLHLLPALDMASVASRYAQSGTPPSQLTVQSVDTDIRSTLLYSHPREDNV